MKNSTRRIPDRYVSGIATQDAGDGEVVGAPEEVQVIEQRIEIVEVAALVVAGGWRAGFLVGLADNAA